MKEGRLEGVEFALATAKLAGKEVSPETVELLKKYADGGISMEEVISSIENKEVDLEKAMADMEEVKKREGTLQDTYQKLKEKM